MLRSVHLAPVVKHYISLLRTKWIQCRVRTNVWLLQTLPEHVWLFMIFSFRICQLIFFLTSFIKFNLFCRYTLPSVEKVLQHQYLYINNVLGFSPCSRYISMLKLNESGVGSGQTDYFCQVSGGRWYLAAVSWQLAGARQLVAGGMWQVACGRWHVAGGR